MVKAKYFAPAIDVQTDQQANAVNRLADEIHVLREVLDELRSVVRHGILSPAS
jgi:hypothetical protein